MTRRFSARLTAVIILLAVLVLGFSPAANAAPGTIVDSGPTVTSSACKTSGNSGSDSPLLPVSRWGDATSTMHSRLAGGLSLSDATAAIERNQIIGNGMAMGNFMWGLGTDMSAFAIKFCMLDKAGGAADEVVAKLGKTLMNPSNGLFTFLLVAGVVGLMFQGARRGAMPWKRIASKGVIVGFIAVMILGATNSTGGGVGGSQEAYRPGVGSPGWFVTTLNNTVASLASAPAAALSLDTGVDSTTAGALSCDRYTTAMKQGYRDLYGSGTGKLSAGVPLIMSGMWEDTGMKTWRTAQFGNQDQLSDQAWCRLLEWNAGSRLTGNTVIKNGQESSLDPTAHGSSVRNVMWRSMPAYAMSTDYSGRAFSVSDQVMTDRSLIAWSACRLTNGADPSIEGSWNVHAAFASGDSKNEVEPADCKKWWSEPSNDLGVFNWPDKGADIMERTAGNLDLRDYVMTLHGNSNAQGVTSVFAYNLSALCMLVVFGGISLAIIFAKVAMVVMIIVALVQALMLLLPNGEIGKLVGPLRMILGLSLFVFGVQFIFALMSTITRMLQGAGSGLLGGSGNLFAILWTGLSPVLACVILHMMFTKVLKVPSPFKLSSGLAWGTAAAAAGGAATAGVSNMLDRGQSKLTNRAKNAGAGAGRSIKSGANRGLAAATGGRLGTRKGSAIPGAAAAGAAGAAAGIAAAGTRKGSAGAAVVNAVGKDDRGKLGGAVSEVVETDKKGHAKIDKKSGQEKTRLKLDHEILAGSTVANSELAKGPMDRRERKLLEQAAADELKAAKEFRKEENAALGITEPTGKAARAMKSIGNATQDFRSRPLNVLGKGTKVAGAGVGLIAVGAVTGGLVPAAAAAAYVAPKAIRATRRVVGNAKGNPKVRTAAERMRDDQMVANYRQAMERKHQAEAKAAAEAKREEKKDDSSESGSSSNKSSEKSGQRADPLRDGAAPAPAGVEPAAAQRSNPLGEPQPQQRKEARRVSDTHTEAIETVRIGS